MDNPTSHQQMEDPALTQSSSLLHYSFCFRPRDRIFFTFFWPSSGAMSMHWSLKYASADCRVPGRIVTLVPSQVQKARSLSWYLKWVLVTIDLRSHHPITLFMFHISLTQKAPCHCGTQCKDSTFLSLTSSVSFFVFRMLSSLQAHYSKLWCLQLIFNYSFYAWRNGNTS